VCYVEFVTQDSLVNALAKDNIAQLDDTPVRVRIAPAAERKNPNPGRASRRVRSHVVSLLPFARSNEGYTTAECFEQNGGSPVKRHTGCALSNCSHSEGCLSLRLL
jgi:hypothetical protein